jgi:uncharacterized protein (TIRG00374 family)
MSTGRAVKLVERALLAGGIGLFVFLLYQLGADTVLANLRLVAWGIVPIILQEGGALAANTLGWRAAFAPPRPEIPFAKLLATRLAGDAVNYVTPTATLGGEFVRLRMLRGEASNTELMASLTVAKLTQTIGQILFILVGLLFILREIPLDEGMRRALAIVLMGFCAVAAGFLLLQRRGMFAPALRLLRRLGVPHTPELAESLMRLDAEIARFHGHAFGPFALSVAAFAAGWALGVVEIYLILWFLEVDVTVSRALTIEVLSAIIDGVLFFVPAKAGTQEGGKVLIFTLLGLDPAKGLALGIVRRIRELSWAGVGLLLWSRHQWSTSPPAARPDRRG